VNEAELLLTDILGCSRTDLYVQKGRRLGSAAGSRMAGVLRRRFRGEPFQYIIGTTEFMGMPFAVAPEVLVPRPETELLVEKVISLYTDTPCVRILDIGTGSGCIAIALAKMIAGAHVTATDISSEALAVARRNAIERGVVIDFVQADLFPVSRKHIFDCIVSNPPYIPSREIDMLQPEVQRQPRCALDGGADGLDFYRRIITHAHEYLADGGYVVVEIGFGQSRTLQELFKEKEKFDIIAIIQDYARIDRIVVARLI